MIRCLDITFSATMGSSDQLLFFFTTCACREVKHQSTLKGTSLKGSPRDTPKALLTSTSDHFNFHFYRYKFISCPLVNTRNSTFGRISVNSDIEIEKRIQTLLGKDWTHLAMGNSMVRQSTLTNSRT